MLFNPTDTHELATFPPWVDVRVNVVWVPLLEKIIWILARVCGDWVKQKLVNTRNKFKLIKNLNSFKCIACMLKKSEKIILKKIKCSYVQNEQW